ncbi:MAG: hypothetical protein ABI432_00260 [Flavobacteriales bacterium]
MAIDTDANLMDGGLLRWSDDLVICPHPIDNQGNNVVLTTGWPIEADPHSFLYGRVDLHQAMHIDTLEVICARGNGGPDSIDVAVQFNVTDSLHTTTVLQGALTNEFITYTATDLGCAPMIDQQSGWMNVYLQAHGGDLGFLLKQIRVVASPCAFTPVEDMGQEAILFLPTAGGVNITVIQPTDVVIADALGRRTFQKRSAAGTEFIPLNQGLNIVRVGGVTRKFIGE